MAPALGGRQCPRSRRGQCLGVGVRFGRGGLLGGDAGDRGLWPWPSAGLHPRHRHLDASASAGRASCLFGAFDPRVELCSARPLSGPRWGAEHGRRAASLAGPPAAAQPRGRPDAAARRGALRPRPLPERADLFRPGNGRDGRQVARVRAAARRPADPRRVRPPDELGAAAHRGRRR